MKKYRWVVVVVLWILYIINYFDRTSVMTFLPFIIKDLQITHFQAGAIASSFFFAYSLAQFSSGPLADRFGPKKVMYVAIGVFTSITFVTGFVRSFTQFIILRLGLGLGEGHHWAPATRAVTNWFPKNEKGRATALLASTAAVAPAIIPITVVWLSVVLGGWRPVFFLLAIPGVIGIFVLKYFIEDTPQKSLEKGRLSKEEFEFISADLAETDSGSGKTIPFKEQVRVILGDYSFWLYSLVVFCLIGVYWGCNSWISSFLYEQHKFKITTMGALASLPYFIAFLSMNFGGYAVDHWFKGKTKPVLATSYLLNIPILFFITQVPVGQTGMLVVMLMLLGFMTNLALGVIYIYPQMRYPKQVVGSAIGFSNGIGQFGGFIAPMVAGALVQQVAGSISYTKAFSFFAILSFVAFLLCLFINEKPKISELPAVAAGEEAAVSWEAK